MQHVDTLIYAGWIIPVVPENVVYEQHALAIQDGKIVGLLPNSEAVSRFSGRITHRLPSHVLIPGLINTHTHAAMSLLRGIADDLPLQQWLQTRIWPVEQACVSPEFVADGTRLAVAEMLRSGITCFNDMYFFPDVAGDVAAEVGIRATIGLIVLDFPTPWASQASEYLSKAKDVYKKFQHHPLIRTAMAPHAPYTVSDDALQKASELSEQFNIPFHIHLHETLEEVEAAEKEYGERPIARLNRLGMINSRLIAVHATQLQNDEIKLFAREGVKVAHCPESNLKLASGFCPVPKLSRVNIVTALGTDGAASNNDLDILGEMRTAALLAKGLSRDASCIPAAEALRMATLNGAKALGIDHLTGSLEIGKSADITALDVNHLESLPIYNILSQLVYAIGRDKVSDVWVAGRHLLKARVLTSIDIHELQAKTWLWRERIVKILQKQSKEATQSSE
jgi:5-methylthioadenosine/S-adenosylhomocysteine deaminase